MILPELADSCAIIYKAASEFPCGHNNISSINFGKGRKMKAAILSIMVMACPVFAGRTIYVDVDATGANDGSSWANAYNYVQDALTDANASEKLVEIRVAQGVYTPDSNSAMPDGIGDREATFHLINGVTLRGGYTGIAEPDPDARDVAAYETILSGDLNGDDAFGRCVK